MSPPTRFIVSDHPDLDTQNDLLAEKAQEEYQPISYLRRVTPLDDLDEVHMEVEESDEHWADAVTLFMLVKAPPASNPLTKFGVDESRDLTIQIPTILLERAGLATRSADLTVECVLDAGDRFVWAGVIYDVMQATQDQHWANTYYPLFWTIKAKIYRHEATEMPDLPYDDPTP